MTIARQQSQQLSEFGAPATAELSLAGLNQQFIAGFEIFELDLAASRIEVMPFGGLDLVAILRLDTINVSGRSSHERRNSRPHRHAHLFAEGAAIHGRLNIDPSVVQIADPYHAELRRETSIGRHTGVGGANILG